MWQKHRLRNYKLVPPGKPVSPQRVELGTAG